MPKTTQETAKIRAWFQGFYPLIDSAYGPGQGPVVHNPFQESDPEALPLGDAGKWWTPLSRYLNDDPTQLFMGVVYYPTQTLNQQFPSTVERRDATGKGDRRVSMRPAFSSSASPSPVILQPDQLRGR